MPFGHLLTCSHIQGGAGLGDIIVITDDEISLNTLGHMDVVKQTPPVQEGPDNAPPQEAETSSSESASSDPESNDNYEGEDEMVGVKHARGKKSLQAMVRKWSRLALVHRMTNVQEVSQ